LEKRRILLFTTIVTIVGFNIFPLEVNGQTNASELNEQIESLFKEAENSNNKVLERSQQLEYQAVIPSIKKALSLKYAEILNDLAILYESEGRYEEAESSYLEAIKIYYQNLGVNHLTVADTLNNLAALYGLQRRFKEAELLYLKSLEIRKQQLEADHPHIATSLNNLASVYKSQGKYEKAEPLYLQSLEINKTKLGGNHPKTASSLNNLGSLYKSQKRYKEAEQQFISHKENIRKPSLFILKLWKFSSKD